MTDLLKALNTRASVARLICFLALLASAATLLLAAGNALVAFAGVPLVPLQCAIWAGWLIWLGVVFPRNRRRDEAKPCPFPYRRAFLREILLGVAVAFSQLLRPAVAGITADGRVLPLVPSTISGLTLIALGAGIVYLGVSALGVARTLFVYEYVPTNRPVTIVGIFRVLRHPLFLGGSMASLGLALCAGTQTALQLGLLNLCVIPIYVQLEDRRCCATLGQAYVDYRAAVGGVIPRRGSAIGSSALEHPGPNISPPTTHNLARTQ